MFTSVLSLVDGSQCGVGASYKQDVKSLYFMPNLSPVLGPATMEHLLVKVSEKKTIASLLN